MSSSKIYNRNDIFITGIGVTAAIGQGQAAFTEALMQGQHSFDLMKRPGRQKGTTFLGAEISSLHLPERLSKRLLRTASFSGQVALATLLEAWEDAKLDDADSHRIGLVIGGSNLQQRELIQTYEAYADRIDFIRPTFGISFMDSDLVGLCTEQFGIRGFAYTLGGASASGQAAIIQAIQAVRSNQVDICIAIGGLMDLSYVELQAFHALGAMGSERYANDPDLACRPFDRDRDGFIYGESCGVVVIEKADSAYKRRVSPYACTSGWAITMDGNRNPNPSYDGEVQVIREALRQAELSADQIDYINPHGTGSLLGDETEVKAICDCGLSHAYLNATKSIVGHGLSAAGTVEAIATLVQMKESRLHPTRNLDQPIDDSLNWVKGQSVRYSMTHALNLSMGFGGINTALCLRKV
ncbi:beta-ketoacyl synthase N-terminal-like domain-containing protein [Brevibacillus laterosporus]|uniref:Beta-ketoacyl synthase N-terminal-like domain-containing protein n=1 Tax=Brevibacillus laterosporus TaxID=1465 RepID=A0AAP3DE93_BRELA|nr:beta-ketoacyl synthase N-terminal-like domain-containing protein [Brevibacillus laterosporus]MCR8978415.1 polyketide beta-ketoacyl:ACP synthase [Brevibacillus laterosporus]MCZ0805570.1 beta-ketoacyl synthase N-terminal-like domain-containing protein [Brevibacillus laterosporus]MCZ0825292.1 beta-ketoacyl synthase N-terminal-like domain-containing protein [Brevibacillus laterosporus]MCZ0849068.1 beta-ketoacyl synthase N-terminal-like domain-containing protein [Brevibacillus laterosporus]MED16